MNGLFALFSALSCLATGTTPDLDVSGSAPPPRPEFRAVRALPGDRHSTAHRYSPGRRHHSHGAVRHQHRIR